MDEDEVSVMSSGDESQAQPASTEEALSQDPAQEEENEENKFEHIDAGRLNDPGYCYRGLAACEAEVEAEEVGDATPFIFGNLSEKDVVKLILDEEDCEDAYLPGRHFNAARLATRAPSGLLLSRRSQVGYLIQRSADIDLDLGIEDGKLGKTIFDLIGRHKTHFIKYRQIYLTEKKVVALSRLMGGRPKDPEGLYLRLRRKLAMESGVTRVLYCVEKGTGQLVGERVYVEMFRTNKHSEVIRSGTMYEKAGRKGAEHFKGAGRKSGSIVRPLSAIVENAQQAEQRTAAQYADLHGLFTPNRAQLAELLKPRAHMWQPTKHKFHSGEIFYVHTLKSAKAAGIRNLDTRRCPSCTRRISDPNQDPPGDLMITHMEKWVEPRAGHKDSSFSYETPPPPSSLAAGQAWVAHEAALIESGNYRWSRYPGQRTYHCRFNCIVQRHQFIELGMIKLGPGADLSHLHYAWLLKQLGWSPQ